MSSQKVYISNDILSDLKKECRGIDPESIFFLGDKNTSRLCMPVFRNDEYFSKSKYFEIEPNDDHKSLDALASVWNFLSNNGASRKSLMINVGGGMITDLGGFAASTFKRGMLYINVPTTLLGAVDAAVGGKTGINFNGLKNEVGVINPSMSVVIDVNFFKTLDKDNFLSGYAEMIKHGLISADAVWEDVLSFNLSDIDYSLLPDLLRNSIRVKEQIVELDPYEKDIRKSLNLGHTVGHAFESYAMECGKPVLHGFAVAWGLIAELYLSYKKCGFPKEVLAQVVSLVKGNYGVFNITCKEYDRLYELMTHDKKNEGDGRILFTLMLAIGRVDINVSVSKEEVFEALDFYRDSLGI